MADKGEFTFQQSAAGKRDPLNMVTVDDVPFLSNGVSLRAATRHEFNVGPFGKTRRLQPAVTVSGVRMSHITGRQVTYNEEFVAVLDDNAGVTIHFQLDPSDSAAERKRLVDSVLASVDWKSS